MILRLREKPESRKRARLLPVTIFLLSLLKLHASDNLEIIVRPEATHIAQIGSDSIVVNAGHTFLFTVDSPEDAPAASTCPTTSELLSEIFAEGQTVRVTDPDGKERVATDRVRNSDRLVILSPGGLSTRSYTIQLAPFALSPCLELNPRTITVNTTRDIIFDFTAGQRGPNATVTIVLPPGIHATLDNTTVDVIGRGPVTLRYLADQSIGRAGNRYSKSKVGDASIQYNNDGSSALLFTGLDFRPANGIDLRIVIRNVKLNNAGVYRFRSTYSVSEPESLMSRDSAGTTELTVVPTISDFRRVIDRHGFRQSWTTLDIQWSPPDQETGPVTVVQSTDRGKTWALREEKIESSTGNATLRELAPDKLYFFQLRTGRCASNTIQFYSGRVDIKSFEVSGQGNEDDTDKVNQAIDWISGTGGGILYFSNGSYNVRTIHLRDNVYLYLDKDATISAIQGLDDPEATWFSDRQYRSGVSPTNEGPYRNPENWLTKQDVGHHFFRNAMFSGERLENVKILGNGRISGNGNLATGDGVMKNPSGRRADKMFSFKLCTNIEIGGIPTSDDLWYDEEKDAPYYIRKNAVKNFDDGNMLQIDQGGHFVVLATGCDNVHVHDVQFGKATCANARDILDFMQCNDVTVTNVYSRLSSDDLVKIGSDCSLGFTRPGRNYRIRNIIGDTNCNLFQIGSETADDIMDVYVDNIYVNGANKAGFSISSNDGANIQNVFLNSGKTGRLHSQSRIRRSYTPFFISISNRGRVLGATVQRVRFLENGVKRDELINTNINIGGIENVTVNAVDVTEMFRGSSFHSTRWAHYDGTQPKAPALISGFKLPKPGALEGSLTVGLPNGKQVAYVRNVMFRNIRFVAEGGGPLSLTSKLPPELGVGQYNPRNFGQIPAYGLWARHVENLSLQQCSFHCQKPDSTYPISLDDVIRATICGTRAEVGEELPGAVQLKDSKDVTADGIVRP